MNIDNIPSIKSPLINRNILHILHTLYKFDLAYFMLLDEKSPEIFPKHNGHFFIPESFASN